MEKKILLVPDVHGRQFWKDILPFVDECEKIVFLGDYHDPYEYEGISYLDSINNFEEIVEFTKSHSDKVTLLIGNHDLSYYRRSVNDRWNVSANRFDVKYTNKLFDIFTSNHELFKIIDMATIPGKMYQLTDSEATPASDRVFLFSHAGVQNEWIERNKLIENYNVLSTSAETICKTLTDMFNKGDFKFRYALNDIGFYRGGHCECGSIVWSDCHEFFMAPPTPYVQIFGHTQQLKQVFDHNIEEHTWNTWVIDAPAVYNSNICIDCHKCFYIDDEGLLRDLKTDEIIY